MGLGVSQKTKPEGTEVIEAAVAAHDLIVLASNPQIVVNNNGQSHKKKNFFFNLKMFPFFPC